MDSNLYKIIKERRKEVYSDAAKTGFLTQRQRATLKLLEVIAVANNVEEWLGSVHGNKTFPKIIQASEEFIKAIKPYDIDINDL